MSSAVQKQHSVLPLPVASERRLRVYLAGPEVFRTDCEGVFENFRHECERAGFEALSPFDADLCEHSHGDASLARRIYQANARLIHQCDAVVANLNSFRGSEPDSGTAWEMGFAVALGKPVIVCLDSLEDYRSRVKAHVGETLLSDSEPLDVRHHMRIEDMGLPLNLMLACSASAIVHGELPEALVALRAFDQERLAQEEQAKEWKDPTRPRALHANSPTVTLESLSHSTGASGASAVRSTPPVGSVQTASSEPIAHASEPSAKGGVNGATTSKRVSRKRESSTV